MRLIDADAANVDRISCFYGDRAYLDDVQEWINEQPTVDPVKHGHWHDVYMISQQTIAQTCSCCSNSVVRSIANVFHYCPTCGAKMDL